MADKKILRLAMLQMLPPKSPGEAAEKAESYCRRAAEQGADIALLPEMWNVGYDIPKPDEKEKAEEWMRQAIAVDDPFVQRFGDLARELEMAIGVTFLEKWDGRPRNTIALFDRRGRHVLTYAKVHTCEFDREAWLTPGGEFPVCALDTRHGDVQVGAMICYDREFPETARLLMLNGAELILVPNACGMEVNRLTQLRARAYENMLAVALTNYAKSDKGNGHSVAFSGISFSRDEESVDMQLAEGGEGEEIVFADLDLEALRKYRGREVWGNAFRRPRLYGPLVSEEVMEPFNREKATR